MSGISSSLHRFLVLLKKQGPMPAGRVALELGLTVEGARFQLQKLAEEGLVQCGSENRGVGRPVQIWQLSTRGNALFPDAHAELSLYLLQAVEELLGQQVLELLVQRRESAIRTRYQQQLAAIHTLQEKVARIAELRSNEGYVAEYQAAEGALLLVENHCPVCMAAQRCGNICAAELETLQVLLGEEAQVKRVEHVIGGDRRCVYRVEQKQ